MYILQNYTQIVALLLCMKDYCSSTLRNILKKSEYQVRYAHWLAEPEPTSMFCLYSHAHSQQMSKLDLLPEAKTMFTWSQRNCVQESSRGNHSTHRPIPLPAGRGNAKKADFKEGVSIFRHQNGFHQLMGCNTSRVESGRAEGHNEGETTWMSASSKLFPFHVLE